MDREKSELEQGEIANPVALQIELNWSDVTYTVSKTVYNFRSLRHFRRRQNIQLLKNLSGSVGSGKLTAVIGPSGVGKTKLLECLAGSRRLGLKGSICVVGPRSVKMAYQSDADQLLGHLTIRESLIFASKLKNYKMKEYKSLVADTAFQDGKVRLELPTSHDSIVNDVLDQLRLGSCADVRVKNCSGGERKRLCIAMQLLSNPNVLLLDEPTSGLDSSSSLQCISLMQRLAHNPHHPMAVVASIHQSSAKLLAFFDHLYIMATGGRCIYNGPVDQLLPYLAQFGLHCPNYHNPADFVTEVAIGMHGEEVIDTLENSNHELILEEACDLRGVPIRKVLRKSRGHRAPESYATWLLLQRSNRTILRDPLSLLLRVGCVFFVTILVSVLYYDSGLGRPDGCEMSPIGGASDWADSYKEQILVGDNVSFLFFSILSALMNGLLPTVMIFPLEMGVVVKERADGLYSSHAYYLAKSLSDLPYYVLFPFVYSLPSYHVTGQIAESWRFFNYICVLFAVSFISQSFGLLVGALHADDLNSAVMSGAIVTLPILLLGGVLVRIAAMHPVMRYFCNLSYFRFAFEAMLVSIYGFGRCPERATNATEGAVEEWLGDRFAPLYDCFDEAGFLENVTDGLAVYNANVNSQSGSMVLDNFGLDDARLKYCWIALAVYFVALRFAGFFLLHWKAKQKK